MEKHLLLTVSEQKSALHGARFLAGFFGDKDVVKLTLFYTIPRPAAVWTGEKTQQKVVEQEDMARKGEAKAKKALQEAKSEVIKLGFSGEQVQTRLQMRQFSKVKDILEEGERGLYDAIILGKRGLNWFEEAFDGSVTKELLESRHNCPIWICRRPDPERKGVLLCMDGSEGSYRMADHVGFVLGTEQRHPVKILVIKGRALQDTPEAIIAKGRELLSKSKVPNVRVTASAIDASSPARAILREAEEGGYAVVAAARGEQEKSLMDKVFLGSVTMTLFREIENAALWVSG
ncbi:MAG: universal stress protein [Desulfobacteraceae bacterium]|jgi:nucleotide-binding universal stress UspA family protein